MRPVAGRGRKIEGRIWLRLDDLDGGRYLDTPSIRASNASYHSHPGVQETGCGTRCSCSRCRVRRTSARLTALLLLPRVRRPGRPRLQTRLVVPRGHPGQQLLHHPRAQRIARAERGHRRQGRLLAVPARARGAAAPAAGARRRSAPSPSCPSDDACGPPGAGPSARPAPRASSRNSVVQRGQPVRMHPPQQVLPRGRHPGQHRLHQAGQLRTGRILRLAFAAVSLCSLLHWRLLGPRRWGPLSWPTSILRPTREPSLLSSQVQHGAGTSPNQSQMPGSPTPVRHPCGSVEGTLTGGTPFPVPVPARLHPTGRKLVVCWLCNCSLPLREE